MNKFQGGDRKFGGDKKFGGDFKRRGSSDRGDRGNRGGFGGDRERPEMFKAICAECGSPCEVPFKPSGNKPVLCSNCFKGSDRSSDRRDDRRSGGRSFDRERPEMFKAICADCGASCEVPFKPSGDKPVYCSNCFTKKGESGSAPRHESHGSSNSKLEEKIEAIHAKVEKILKLLNADSNSTPILSIPKVINVPKINIPKDLEILAPEKMIANVKKGIKVIKKEISKDAKGMKKEVAKDVKGMKKVIKKVVKKTGRK
jgi:CxxC-x17-CxxC domain-containing protein